MYFFFKIGVPSWKEVESWGDYHLVKAIGKELEKRGHSFKIQILPEWKGPEDSLSDITVHVKGLTRYKPKRGPMNIMWLISHPDKVTIRELKRYDLILVASRPFASWLKKKIDIPVYTLLQFADSDLMYPDPELNTQFQLVFLGNSRLVRRRIIADLLPTKFDLNVWGSDWEGIIPKQYIKGRYFPYENVRKVYSAASIVLNDHWEDMRNKGFINNRIFDALACRAFVLSDRCEDLEILLHQGVITYHGKKDLYEKISYYLDHKSEREEIALQGYEMVVEQHSVHCRVDDFLNTIN
ncbi:MAG: glycosyltransferase family 1 protein [Bacteroidales bacterium]|nr:glycosyltransferase family 1 protein [Bacteroidales bacterium]